MRVKKILFTAVLGLGAAFFAFVAWNYMRPRPTVSVLLSTYNRAHLLPLAVSSVLNQTYTDFEFIIINDGSKDNTAALLEKYEKADPRIRVFTNNPNKGLIDSLNFGLKKCRGKYIARFDDDDEMAPTRLEEQVARMEAQPDAALVASTYIFYNRSLGKQGRIGCFEGDQLRAEIMFANMINHSTVLLNKKFLNDNKIQYSRAYPDAEDYDLWRQILVKGGEGLCIRKPLTIYKRAADNPQSFYDTQWRSVLKIQQKFLNLFFDRTEQIHYGNLCEHWETLIERAEQRKWTTRAELTKLEPDVCPEHFEPHFLATFAQGFSDILLYVKNDPTGKTVRRKRHRRDQAIIAEHTATKLVLDWKDRGREEFTCTGNVCQSVTPLSDMQERPKSE